MSGGWSGVKVVENPVPLLWSTELADDASLWAQQLLDDCDTPVVNHEPGVDVCESLAKNVGQTDFGKGQLSSGNIMLRWVDNDKSW